MQKKKLFLIIIVLVILGINTNVLAFDLAAYIDSQKLDQKQVQISLQVSDLDANPEGINAISGKIVFDSNVFNTLSLTGTNNWSAIYNDEEKNENRGKFILITTAGNITKDTYVANIVFSLNPNVNNVQTQIKIEQIETSYQSEKISANDEVINLEIKDNNIKIIENQSNINNNKEFNNYTIFTIIIAVIILLISVLLIIKYKEKRTNEK